MQWFDRCQDGAEFKFVVEEISNLPHRQFYIPTHVGCDSDYLQVVIYFPINAVHSMRVFSVTVNESSGSARSPIVRSGRGVR